MKIINQYPRVTFLALLFTSISALVSSCSKDGVKPPAGTAHIKVVNAVEGSAAQDLYFNNNKITTTAVAYGNASNYLTANAGNDNGQLKDSGSATVNASFTTLFDVDDYYSVYYQGNDTTTSVIITQDDKTPPPSGQARVRFIFLSDAVSKLIDINTSTNAKLVSKVAYKTVTTYYNIDPTQTFSINISGTSTTLLSIPLNLQAGDIYTVYITGSTALSLSFHIVPEE